MVVWSQLFTYIFGRVVRTAPAPGSGFPEDATIRHAHLVTFLVKPQEVSCYFHEHLQLALGVNRHFCNVTFNSSGRKLSPVLPPNEGSCLNQTACPIPTSDRYSSTDGEADEFAAVRQPSHPAGSVFIDHSHSMISYDGVSPLIAAMHFT
ncbi:hypothetical protein J6590_003552 [Homalodisca vitripennis]|nr:hypothetical protein J6590_003552 [Homalodisca vitripennis]